MIGGELYHIIKPLRNPFYADAGSDMRVDVGETVTLQAKNIGEEAIYRWYDQNGELICDEQECEIEVNREQTCKLEVTALADGYKDYDKVNISINPCGKIKSMFPNPVSDNLTIDCILNNASDASIQITDYFGLLYAEHALSPDATVVSFNTDGYPVGTYVVKLICGGGAVADMKTFVKK